MLSDFDTLKVGDRRSLTRVIGEADVRRFVEMTGDDNPLHLDAAYAQTTPFKDVVVHGMLGASFISTVIGTQLPGPGALWVSQSLEFLAPVRLGDTLTVTCCITAKHDRERLLELDTTIVNQDGARVLAGGGKVKVLASRVSPAAQAEARPRVALVTGGGGGIGRAICERLAREGLDVVVGFRVHPERAAATVAAIEALECSARAVAVQADLATAEGVAHLARQAVRAFGEVDVLVNNASPTIAAKPLSALSWADVQAHLDVQVKAALLLTQACLPAMLERRFGRVVNITSQVTEGPPTPTWTAYAVAKAALAAMSRQIAVEVGPGGVTVNCVAPGMTETALIGGVPEKIQLTTARQTPLRRLATPGDIAGAVAYLASPDAGFVTGQTLSVNGGLVMR